MKLMKLALLGSAALVAASAGARAENLDALKAQIETLNARVATLEATPAVPSGYSLLSFSKDEAGHHISILPTADAPAAASITWSGFVRAAVVTNYTSAGTYSTDIRTRAHLTVSGSADTAVGEIGGNIALVSDSAGGHALNAGNNAVNTDGYSGWWKLTSNLKLEAGVGGTLAKSGQSYDANCTCYYIDPNGGVGGNGNGDPSHVQLAYADGPLSFAVQVEDGNNVGNTSAFGGSSKASYKADMFSLDVEGGYWGNAKTGSTDQSAWAVTGGIGASVGILSFGVGAGAGSLFSNNDDWTKASGYAKAALSENVALELGLTHQWNSQQTNTDYTEFDVGLYYNPVKQLTIGLEGTTTSGGANDGAYTADLVTVFRF